MTELHAVVRGRVQLVMFRDFTQRRARKLKLTGTVKNSPDGTVEVIAQGDRAALETLLEAIKGGPLLARVDAVDSEWRNPTRTHEGFKIVF